MAHSISNNRTVAIANVSRRQARLTKQTERNIAEMAFRDLMTKHNRSIGESRTNYIPEGH